MENVNILKALNENTNTQGGFLVPEIWADKVYELITAKSTALQLCEQAVMTSDTMYLPKVTSASTAYFTSEASTITASDPAFSQITLSPRKIAALTQLSSEVLEDSNPSVQQIVMERLAEDIALKLDYSIYNGTTSTEFVGFREASGIDTVDAAGLDIELDDVADAIEGLASENIQATDIIMHPKVYYKLMKKKTGISNDNTPLLSPVTFNDAPVKSGMIGNLMGLNVIQTTQLPTNLSTDTYTSLTDVIVVARKKCGIFARRRELQLNKFYQIDTDDWKIQSNLRAAFSVNYEKAISVIQNVATT